MGNFVSGGMIHLIVLQCKQHSILLSLKIKFHFDDKSCKMLHFSFQCSTPLPILWFDICYESWQQGLIDVMSHGNNL